jgi:hypothetical protein
VSDVVNTGQFNLFAGSEAIVMGKYTGSTITSDVAATTRTGSRNFKNSFNVVSKPENSFIPRLWAYTRIKKLMDRIDVEGETDTLVSSVTSISLEFKFVTPYTSLFVEVPKNATKTTTATAIDAKAEAASIVPQSVTPGATVAAVVATTVAAAATAPPSSAPQYQGGQEAGKQAASASTSKAEPGFELVFAMIGLFVIKYLVVRRRK